MLHKDSISHTHSAVDVLGARSSERDRTEDYSFDGFVLKNRAIFSSVEPGEHVISRL